MLVVAVVAIVVDTLAHLHNLGRGHKTGSDNALERKKNRKSGNKINVVVAFTNKHYDIIRIIPRRAVPATKGRIIPSNDAERGSPPPRPSPPKTTPLIRWNS